VAGVKVVTDRYLPKSTVAANVRDVEVTTSNGDRYAIIEVDGGGIEILHTVNNVGYFRDTAVLPKSGNLVQVVGVRRDPS
jgi:hypothetical protein